MIRVEFTIVGQTPVTVDLRTDVAINDGSAIEREPPEGADTPRVLSLWRCDDQKLLAGSPFVAEAPGRYAALLSQPQGTAVAVDFHVTARRPGQEDDRSD